MYALALTLVIGVGADIENQRLDVTLDPASGKVEGATAIQVNHGGDLHYELNSSARVHRVVVNGAQRESSAAGIVSDLKVGDVVEMFFSGIFRDDIESGEKVGQIHNFSVNAHVGEEGIFLSDGSNWYPQPVDEAGVPLLREMAINIAPMEGWTLVASGNPTCRGPITLPCWSWSTPRRVDGMAVVGNRHEVTGRTVETNFGPVDVTVHLPSNHADKSDYYLDAAEHYLKLYTPLIGAYPYERFAIIENFFSSGFAFPGFTVLGPRVVGMAPKSLKPGYLDHELVHAWWGNGVYVDPSDGNWCEALTSYCTNYGRRALEDGQDAARTYRRGLLNKVSLDPALDNGPVGEFGSADPSGGGPDRFVGYDKGAFVFMMLEEVLNEGVVPASHAQSAIWPVLRHLNRVHMGDRIGWAEIQAAAEEAYPAKPKGWLDPFFETWVRSHTVPLTAADMGTTSVQSLDLIRDPEGQWVEVDPDCRHYRLLPHDQTSPTIAGTLGTGATITVDEAMPAAEDVTAWMADVDGGPSALLVGPDAIAGHAERIARADDTLTIEDGAFTVAGTRWDGEGQSVLHTMHDPDTPGRYITVFYSNGEPGWDRLRFIWYYGKDTTVVWDGDETVLRRAHEPDARIDR
ncbi:MAG: hypothetical protein QGI75_03675 [Phycisphaerales bacterium]|jgi:hypothetical protein|nr:hypothetical protein [Phycisphaerales bacterium]